MKLYTTASRRPVLIVAYWAHRPRTAHHIGWGIRRAALLALGLLLVLSLASAAVLLAALHRPDLALPGAAGAVALVLAGALAGTRFYQLDRQGVPLRALSRWIPVAIRGRRPVRHATFLRQARTSHASVFTRAGRDSASARTGGAPAPPAHS